MWIWEKEKCKWKWRIYLRKRKRKCANESSESRTKRQPNLSIKDQKIANELAECREVRLFNQRQYQKENIKNGSADHIRDHSTREGKRLSWNLYMNTWNTASWKVPWVPEVFFSRCSDMDTSDEATRKNLWRRALWFTVLNGPWPRL